MADFSAIAKYDQTLARFVQFGPISLLFKLKTVVKSENILSMENLPISTRNYDFCRIVEPQPNCSQPEVIELELSKFGATDEHCETKFWSDLTNPIHCRLLEVKANVCFETLSTILYYSELTCFVVNENTLDFVHSGLTGLRLVDRSSDFYPFSLAKLLQKIDLRRFKEGFCAEIFKFPDANDFATLVRPMLERPLAMGLQGRSKIQVWLKVDSLTEVIDTLTHLYEVLKHVWLHGRLDFCVRKEPPESTSRLLDQVLSPLARLRTGAPMTIVLRHSVNERLWKEIYKKDLCTPIARDL